MDDITHVTIIKDNRNFKQYQRGDIGQPLKPHDDGWFIACPGCGQWEMMVHGAIIENTDGTVSTSQPLHCHGSNALRRYRIERNEVRWLDSG